MEVGRVTLDRREVERTRSESLKGFGAVGPYDEILMLDQEVVDRFGWVLEDERSSQREDRLVGPMGVTLVIGEIA
jgi:hypothetical protein